MFDKIMNMARDLTEKIPIGKTDLEKMLFNATSSEPSSTAHHDISGIVQRTFHYEDRDVIMEHLWSRLELPQSEWRKIDKTMYLLDVILREGDPECVKDIRKNSFKLRMLESFSYREDGVERGGGIREKARAVNSLLNDPELLEKERANSKKSQPNYFGSKHDHYQDNFSFDPESYYDSPKEEMRQSKPKKATEESPMSSPEKKKHRHKHKHKKKEKEAPKPSSELFDLLDIPEDNKGQMNATIPVDMFNAHPAPSKPASDLMDLWSAPAKSTVQPVKTASPMAVPFNTNATLALFEGLDITDDKQSSAIKEKPKTSLWDEAEDLFNVSEPQDKGKGLDYVMK